MELPDGVTRVDIVGLIHDLIGVNATYRGDTSGFGGTGVLVSNIVQLLIKPEFIDMRGYSIRNNDDLNNLFYDDVVMSRFSCFEDTNIDFERVSKVCEYGIDMDIIDILDSNGYIFSVNGYYVDYDAEDCLQPGHGFIRLKRNTPIDKIFSLVSYLCELKETNRVEQNAKIESICIAVCEQCI